MKTNLKCGSVEESSKNQTSKTTERLKLVGVSAPLQYVSYPTTIPLARTKGLVIREVIETTYSGLDIKHSITTSDGKGKGKMVEPEEFRPKNEV